jgi:hypothetical protein
MLREEKDHALSLRLGQKSKTRKLIPGLSHMIVTLGGQSTLLPYRKAEDGGLRVSLGLRSSSEAHAMASGKCNDMPAFLGGAQGESPEEQSPGKEIEIEVGGRRG